MRKELRRASRRIVIVSMLLSIGFQFYPASCLAQQQTGQQQAAQQKAARQQSLQQQYEQQILQNDPKFQDLNKKVQQSNLQVQKQESVLNNETNDLQQDERNQFKSQQGGDQYIQTTERWIQQNDAQMRANQNKLDTLEATYKNKATLESLLRTPGNELYVLRSLLDREAAMKAQALENIQSEERSMQLQQSVVEQDRYRMRADQALLQHEHDDSLTQQNSAMLRQAYDVRLLGNQQSKLGGGQSRLGGGRYLNQFRQNPYEIGSQQGNSFWGAQ
ncbi:MAG: hypothetical protein K2Z81_21530 [Cyanobacteria bacterium]|nr:hypothetical protein [Cyanobacteriota bacterium]